MIDNLPTEPSTHVDGLAKPLPPLLTQVADKAGALAQRGLDAVRERSQGLRSSALRASDRSVEYIQAEPVKAVLMAAAAGAALMALLSLVARRRERD